MPLLRSSFKRKHNSNQNFLHLPSTPLLLSLFETSILKQNLSKRNIHGEATFEIPTLETKHIYQCFHQQHMTNIVFIYNIWAPSLIRLYRFWYVLACISYDSLSLSCLLDFDILMTLFFYFIYFHYLLS